MQDATTAGGNLEPLLSARLLGSLSELNRRFLDIAGAAPQPASSEWRVMVPQEISQRIALLTEERRAAISRCPYALFDIRFCDDAHWQCSLRSMPKWRVADVSTQDVEMAEFVQLAVFYSWHLAMSSPLSAPLILGMSTGTARALSRLTLDRIPGLIGSQRHHVSLRWANCKSYWHCLTSAANHPDSNNFRRAQLFGLQVAAATQLRC